jgi:hypothetical protein
LRVVTVPRSDTSALMWSPSRNTQPAVLNPEPVAVPSLRCPLRSLFARRAFGRFGLPVARELILPDAASRAGAPAIHVCILFDDQPHLLSGGFLLDEVIVARNSYDLAEDAGDMAPYRHLGALVRPLIS